MKVRPSVKPICEKCKIIKRKGRIMIIARTRSTSRSRAERLRRRSAGAAGACEGRISGGMKIERKPKF